MKTHLWGIICFSSLALLTSISHASTIYRYQGENYEQPQGIFDTTMRLTGTVEFATPLPSSLFGEVFPISFSFNDGVNTFTEDNLTSSRFGFATDVLGNIVGWEVQLRNEGGDPFLELSSEKTMLSGTDFILFIPAEGEPGILFGNPPGNWSLVPIPPAVWLFGSGLLYLVGIARRKKAA